MRHIRSLLQLDLGLLGIFVVLGTALSTLTGGVAGNGKVEADQHFVFNHGRYVPVSAILYWLQLIVERVIFALALPVLLAAIVEATTRRRFDLFGERERQP